MREPFLAELVARIRYVAAGPALRFFVLATGSVWLAFGAFSALEPLFYGEVLEVGPDAMGWVNSIFGPGLVAGTFRVSPPSVGMEKVNGVGNVGRAVATTF